MSAAAERADEHTSDDHNLVLMPGHRGDDRAPDAESLVDLVEELGEEVGGVLTRTAATRRCPPLRNGPTSIHPTITTSC